jgi:protoporphyrinogen oxidase
LNDPGRVVILGAGPTGLGAAYRLSELGIDTFTVVEARATPGGLAASEVDEHGFTWDIGGHVQFSHYDYYDAVLDRALPDAWLEHERQAWVWVAGSWVPYPFQYNLHRLPPAERDRALLGLERSRTRASGAVPGHFGAWIDATFGEGIGEIFLRPYNEKVWGFSLETLGVEWMGDRVAIPDLERVRRNVREGRDDIGWGPNHRFRYPRRGGTGAIWTSVAALLDADRFRLGVAAQQVALNEGRLDLSGGQTLPFDHLISSAPLDVLCGLSSGLSPAARRAAGGFRHSSCHIVGVGLRGPLPPVLTGKSWIYFPGASSPYYRVTVLSNYSPLNVPAERHWSLMAEICETCAKPIDAMRLPDWTLTAMGEDGLLPPGTDIISLWHRREAYGYPTPFLGRDAALACLLPELERHRVYSRGRFGAWKYEVSNQDHSFMQGVEVVNRLTGLGDEPTFTRPDWVNAGALRAARRPGAGAKAP